MNILANFDDTLTAYFEKTNVLEFLSISDLLKKIDDDLFTVALKYL